MKKLIFLLFFTLLFACNTSSYNAAYNDYYKYQQIYIDALLDNNKQKEKKALKELIECGKYLNFNVSIYEKKLSSLSDIKTDKQKTKKKTVKKKSNKKIKSKYIKIYSTSPLKLRIPTSKIRHFVIKRKHVYKEVIDIPNAITPKFIKRKIGPITLRIAQFNKNTVRVVFSSHKKFSFKYEIKDNKLLAYTLTKGKNALKPQKISIPPTPFKYKKIIVIDPGHGGKDPGGIGLGGREEKVAVLSIAKKLAVLLKKQGYRVYLTRKGDYFIPLQKRTHFANEKNADLFISIHCNIAPRHLKSPNGIEIYYLSPTRSERAIRVAKIENKEIKGLNYIDQRVILTFLNKDRMIDSHKLGIDIMNNVLKYVRKKGFHLKDGGVRPAPFWVLVGTQMPSILIETGYLTNPRDAKNLFNPLFQWQMAKGIADGIDSYFRKNP
ncbi:N-acetylmuramoyl-L-alanine amidase [Caminibacter sp.]